MYGIENGDDLSKASFDLEFYEEEVLQLNRVTIDGISTSIQDIVNVARNGYKVEISEDAILKIKKSRKYVDDIVAAGKVVYGITTGFGEFSKVSISNEDTEALQHNLIISHACGVGNHFSEEVVRAIMVLRVNALSNGDIIRNRDFCRRTDCEWGL